MRELVRDGADVIKIATSGGVLSPTDSPDSSPASRSTRSRSMVAEASAAGLWVMSHAQSTDRDQERRPRRRALDRARHLHRRRGDRAHARARHVPRADARRAARRDPRGRGRRADPGECPRRRRREVVEAHRDSFRRAAAAGVKIAMGTDAGVVPHGTNLEELQLMADVRHEPRGRARRDHERPPPS